MNIYSSALFLYVAAAMGHMNSMLASGAMAFSGVFMATNSLRLRGQKM